MAIKAEETGGGDFQEVSTGPHPAVCYQIIDLGTQRKEYEGNVSFKRQAMVTWEIADESLDDGRPMTISNFYTLSLSKKANLRKDLVSWRGKEFTEKELAGFDITVLAGIPALLNVVENKGRARIGSIMPIPKSMQKPEQQNDTVIFELDAYLNGDTSVWDNLSDGIRKLISKSEEIQHPVEAAVGNEVDDSEAEDIPF